MVGPIALLKRMVREGLTDKVTFEQRFEGVKEATQINGRRAEQPMQRQEYLKNSMRSVWLEESS